MKLTVIKWLKDELTPFVGRAIELFFRILLFILPLGIFLILIQFREKASKVSNLSVYTNDESTWQHIFPGFALVSISPDTFRKKFISIKKAIQDGIEANKYLIEILFMIIVIAFLFKGVN